MGGARGQFVLLDSCRPLFNAIFGSSAPDPRFLSYVTVGSHVLDDARDFQVGDPEIGPEARSGAGISGPSCSALHSVSFSLIIPSLGLAAAESALDGGSLPFLPVSSSLSLVGRMVGRGSRPRNPDRPPRRLPHEISPSLRGHVRVLSSLALRLPPSSNLICYSSF